MEESRRKHAHFCRGFMTDQVDLTVPSRSFDNSDRTDRSVDSIGGSNVVSIGRPRASSKVRSQWRALKRGTDRSLENKVVNHVMLGRIRRGRGESEDFNRSVIACCRKELVCRVKGDSFNVTLVCWKRLKLLKGVP